MKATDFMREKRDRALRAEKRQERVCVALERQATAAEKQAAAVEAAAFAISALWLKYERREREKERKYRVPPSVRLLRQRRSSKGKRR